MNRMWGGKRKEKRDSHCRSRSLFWRFSNLSYICAVLFEIVLKAIFTTQDSTKNVILI